MFRSYATLVLLIASGCSSAGGGSAPSCTEGDLEACACDGAPGLRACGSGGAWEACACDALVAVPAVLDFGLVAPGSRVEATVALSHRGEEAIPIRSAALADGTVFDLVDAPPELPGGGAFAVFAIALEAPVGARPYTDRLRVELDVAGAPVVEIPLRGRHWLECDRTAIDFGQVEVGASASRTLRCTNRLPYHAPTVTRVEVVDADPGAFQLAPPPEEPVATGGSFSVLVTHGPRDERRVQGRLVVQLADPAGHLEVPLAAEGVFARCGLASPVPALTLLPGGTAHGSLALRRTGQADCAIRAIRIDEACDPAFDLSGWPTATVVHEPVELPFVVRSAREGHVRCPIELVVVDPEEPIRQVVLEAEVGWSACLDLAPSPRLDLWARASSCPGLGSVLAANRCEDPLEVSGLALEGAPSFSLDAPPALPFFLEVGSPRTIAVRFNPLTFGEERSELVFSGPAEAREVLPVIGHANQRSTRVETWATGPKPQLDVLAIVDNGAGMAAEEPRVLAALGSLPETLAADFDYHLAVTTSSRNASPSCDGPGGGGEGGRLVPIDGSRPRVVTAGTPDARAVWEANLRVGACHDGPNEALEMAFRALLPPLVDGADDPRTPEPADGNAGFFRREAFLLPILVGDRADVSPGVNLDYLYFLRSLKGFSNPRFALAAVAGDPGTGCTGPAGEAAAPADRWRVLLDAVGNAGAFASICGVDAPLTVPFPELRKRCFYFGYPGADFDGDGALTEAAGEVSVAVNGVSVPSLDAEGRTIWTADERGICFAEGHEPDWDATVRVEHLTC